MNITDEQLDNTAVLLALDFDGEVIGMMTADTIARTQIITWLQRVAADLSADLYNRY